MIPDWTSDRVKFPPNFRFATHNNGFQIQHQDNYYSLIINSDLILESQIKKPRETDMWELQDRNGEVKTFDDIREAAYYIIRSEGYIPEVVDIEEFYGIES